MGEQSWAGFLASARQEEEPDERLYRLAREQAARAERDAERGEAERKVAAEEERERRLFRFQQLGYGGRSLADMAADASRAADEDDQLTEAKKTIQRIERSRAARLEAQRAEAQQLDMMFRAEPVPRDPLEAAQHRARQAADDIVHRARLAQRTDQILRSASRADLPKDAGADADSDPVPDGCSDEQWAAKGFCGCLRCFEREEAAESVRAARVSVPRGLFMGGGPCPHGYIPSSCSECRRAGMAVSYRAAAIDPGPGELSRVTDTGFVVR